MRQRSMLLGNLAAYRELPVQEQERLARSPQARQLLAAFRGQDVLLAALPEPPIPARATTRIWAATVGAPSAVHERSAAVSRPVATLRVWVVATAVLIVLASLGITGYAAAGSLPGDPLYGVKRLEESLQLALTFGEVQRGAYQQRLEERRRAEVQALLAERRMGVAVAFTGDIERATDGRWLVAGVAVALPDEQVALTGEQVSVEGVTADGQVQVRAMANRGARSPLPTPQPPTPGAHPTSACPPAPLNALQPWPRPRLSRPLGGGQRIRLHRPPNRPVQPRRPCDRLAGRVPRRSRPVTLNRPPNRRGYPNRHLGHGAHGCRPASQPALTSRRLRRLADPGRPHSQLASSVLRRNPRVALNRPQNQPAGRAPRRN